MDWRSLDIALRAAEIAGGPSFRICRVFHPDPIKQEWNGIYGGAPVDVGPAAYLTSAGDTITL